MSQENVEQENVRIVREGFAAFNADEGGLEWRLRTLPESLATFCQPDWEYHTDSRDPDTTIHRGRGHPAFGQLDRGVSRSQDRAGGGQGKR
jgi:hypothetical protein